MNNTTAKALGSILVVGLLAGIFVWFESMKPNSTHGVREIGGNLVSLPQGEVFILTRKGKVWSFTYQNNQVAVQAPKLRSNPAPISLCGIDCKVNASFGALGTWDFTMWQQADGTVAIKWPRGWTYRSY